MRHIPPLRRSRITWAGGEDRSAGSGLWAEGLGQFADQAQSDLDFDGGVADADIGAAFGSLYGTWLSEEGRGCVEGVLSYARQEIESRRLVSVDDVSRTATSGHDANTFGAVLGGGYRFELGSLGLRPFGNLSYVLLDEEGFSEKGAGDVSLDVDGRTTHSLVSELGLRAARTLRSEIGTFVPYASAAWKFDFQVDDRTIVSGFLGAPGTSFAVEGRELDRNAALLEAGGAFVRSGWSVSLEYLGEYRGDYTSHGLFGRVGLSF